MYVRRTRRGFAGLGDDISMLPVSVSIPDVSFIPGLDTPTAGVSTDSSGMSEVTVVASQSNMSWYLWGVIAFAAWGLLRGK